MVKGKHDSKHSKKHFELDASEVDSTSDSLDDASSDTADIPTDDSALEGGDSPDGQSVDADPSDADKTQVIGGPSPDEPASADTDVTAVIPAVSPEQDGEGFPAGEQGEDTDEGSEAEDGATIGDATSTGDGETPDGEATVVLVPTDEAEGSALSGEATEDAPVAFPRTHGAEAVKEKMDRKKVALIVVCCVLAALLGVWIGFAIYFQSHFLYRTTINSADCSYFTVDQAEDVVMNQVDNYVLDIETRTGEETIPGSAVDLTYVHDDQVQKLLDSQNNWLWFVPYFKAPDDSTLHASVDLDEKKLTAAVDALDCMDSSRWEPPVDAYPEYNGTEYVVHNEELGTTINTEVIYGVITDSFENTVSSVNLSDEGCYVAPTVYANSQELLDRVALYNQYCRFSITYTFGDTVEVLDGNTAINWFVFADDGTATLSEDAVRAWLSDFGDRHDTVGTQRTFIAADGAEATVEGGSYGWEVDEDAEYDAIMTAMENHTAETREPIWVQTAASYTQPDWGSSYIDLDLTDQHVWVIIDGQSAFDADVVTGLPIPSRQTSPGVWSVLEMQQGKVLTGEMTAAGVPEYRTPVAYWIRMTWTGMGFHDASWQSSFGGDRYTYAGSHGCINMSYSDVQTMYGLVWEGMPIVSHY